ncbi:MAG: hypothetical protein AAFP02_08650, partial [Bacteroidota bacterium]
MWFGWTRSPTNDKQKKWVAEIFRDATETAHIVLSAAEDGAQSSFAFADAAAASADVAALRR